jgi:hypothetical protein
MTKCDFFVQVLMLKIFSVLISNEVFISKDFNLLLFKRDMIWFVKYKWK